MLENVCNIWINLKVVTIHNKLLTSAHKIETTSLVQMYINPCKLLVAIWLTNIIDILYLFNVNSRNDAVSCIWRWISWYRNVRQINRYYRTTQKYISNRLKWWFFNLNWWSCNKYRCYRTKSNYRCWYKFLELELRKIK